MQSVEQYAWEKAAAFREDQGKYHPVDQGEADLEHCFPQFRAASYVQNVAQPEQDGGDHHCLSHAVPQPRSADDASKENFLRHTDSKRQKQVC